LLCLTPFIFYSLDILAVFFFFLISRLAPSCTLFPYTTLFRSVLAGGIARDARGHPVLEAGALGAGPAGLVGFHLLLDGQIGHGEDRKSTRLNSSHVKISYAVFCLKKKNDRPILFNDRAASTNS